MKNRTQKRKRKMNPVINRITKVLKRLGRFRAIPDRFGTNEYLDRYYLLFNKNGTKNEDRHYSFNAFLHQFKSSDEPIVHSHPWNWCSIVLTDGYWEHYKDGSKKWRKPFDVCFRKAEDYHWIELKYGTNPWTLFLHGKRRREWGFLINDKEVSWKDYLAERISTR